MNKAFKSAFSLFIAFALVFGVTVETDFGVIEASAESSLSEDQLVLITKTDDEVESLIDSFDFSSTLKPYILSSSFDSGIGTEDDPYIISTKEQLTLINNHLDCNFKLANDIIFTDEDFAEGGMFFNNEEGWQPIGMAADLPFSGCFDGNNHVIKGLQVYSGFNDVNSDNIAASLFMGLSGTVKNLGLVDCSIIGFAANSGGTVVGGITAVAIDNAVISDCYVTGQVGLLSETIFNVTSANRELSALNIVGGIVGICENDVLITDCYNESDVTAATLASIVPSDYYNSLIELSAITGGITGYGAKIESCYNTGEILSGIVAFDDGTSPYYPTDEMIYVAYAGGISAGNSPFISDCYNKGEVNIQIADEFRSRVTTRLDPAGGISAISIEQYIYDCYNTGLVSGSQNFNGAISGFIGESVIDNCRYLNNVATAGYNSDGSRVSARKCTATEMTTKSTYAGFDFEDTWYYISDKTPQLIGTNPKHVVTWNVDGVKTEELVAEMEKITIPADPEKEGYTFIGWTPEVPETMPSCDITFTAEWLINCTHNYISEITTPATCTTEGIMTYTCSECGDSYTELIPELGHRAGGWETVTESTCTAVGEKAKKCTVCDEVLETEEIAMAEHVAGAWVISIEPTCTEEGEKIANCTVCGVIVARDVIPEKGHRVGAWETVLEPTTEAEGVKVKKCTVCSEILEEAAIAKLPKEPLKDSAVIKTPSMTAIKYGDAIILHVDETKIPEGGRVEWTADSSFFSYRADGATCEIHPEKSGDTTFTATIYDEYGNPILTDEQTMTSKAGFFDKIIAFFKGIFGLNKTYSDVFGF